MSNSQPSSAQKPSDGLQSSKTVQANGSESAGELNFQQLEDKVITYQGLNDQLKKEKAELLSKLREAEKLNRLHPDTGLPIYRFFLQDLEVLINRAGEERNSGQQEDQQTDDFALRLSEASGCADQFAKEGFPKTFSVLVIRLDEAYGRIKNSRDRQKALLYKSSFRVLNKLDRGCMYQSDRLDEFYVVYPGTSSAEQLNQLMKKIVQAIAEPHDPPAEDLRFGAYSGAVSFPDHGKLLEDMLMGLDIAMEEAEKSSSKICLYNPDMGKKYRHRRTVESEMQKAMQQGFDQFKLAFQPLCDTTGKITGAEVLARWEHPSLGMISPALFIPLSETNGSIRLLGRWILFQACRTLAGWIKDGIPALELGINLSPVQFLQKDLVESIMNVLQVNKLPPNLLKLEITEGAIMLEPSDAIQKMLELKKTGIQICIDDFGTGYSSLAYLKELPVDVLKIDKSFVDRLSEDPQNQAIVRAIILLAKSLGLTTLAEGVERSEELAFLTAEGVDSIQGYYYSPPVDGATFRSYLETGGYLPLS